jgi:hypothetical protein
MRCGNKRELGEHEHETIAEVRACYGVDMSKPGMQRTTLSGQDRIRRQQQEQGEPPSREELFGGEVPAQNGPPLARATQLSYLSDLRVERGMDPLPPNTQMFRSVASATIAQLLLVKPKVKQAATVTYANVPAGHYAIKAPEGSGRDYDFYRVDKPTEGQWAGRTFLKMVVGGKPDVKIKDRNRIAEVLAAIAVKPDEAAWRYGQELGQCNVCNRHLTDKISRAYSRGSECREKYGLGFRGALTSVFPNADPGVRRIRQARPAGAPAPSRPARRAG